VCYTYLSKHDYFKGFMNERIQKLKQQAIDYAWNLRNEGNSASLDNLFQEKFAELLVQECAKIVEDSTWNLPHGYKAVDQANLVKKHFGVEE
jgi:hypothetical protein